MPCDCLGAKADNLGHLYIRCRAGGCPSIWYRPRASARPGYAGAGQAQL